ncbi:MAG TPA: hypothetical protein VGN95_16490 [Pyrinomonadaceae bacterium]|jgi:hypothetical protein|nr:hypothetical protein [Pyrinomonadaceae bacterium]
MNIQTLFFLLAIYQLKHWLADYRFQTAYMLRKGAGGFDWILPLTAHASVHAFLTLLIVAGAAVGRILAGSSYPLLWVALPFFDFLIHFVVDRIKAAPSLGGRWQPSQPQFWRALGADQMAHHLTHYTIIFLLVN